MTGTVRSGWIFATLLAAPAPAPAGPPQAGCFPACREGYVCHQSQCVSWCNPPCPSGQTCIEGRRCDYPPPIVAGQPVFEPPLPTAKAFEARNFFMMGFHLGFSGTVDIDATTVPLDSTIGFNLRGDVPLERYILLGPLVQFGAWRPDGSPPPNWNYYIDADLYIRGRIPISTDSTKFQLWAGVPIGFTVDFLGQDTNSSGFGIGWNVGVLTGGAVHFTPNFGMFAELGWMQHRISHSGQTGDDLDFRLAQGNFNVGIVLKD